CNHKNQKQHKTFERRFGSYLWNISLKVWNGWRKVPGNTYRGTCRHIGVNATTQDQREHQPEDAVASGERLHGFHIPDLGIGIGFQVLLVSVAQQGCQLLTKV